MVRFLRYLNPNPLVMKTSGFYLLCMLSIATTYAQSPKSFTVAKPEDAGMSNERLARIDTYFQNLVTKKQIPGAVTLIIRNGKIVHNKTYGYSDIESGTALKKDNIFRIASQSKAITALAVMMLYEEGKFQLDEPVSKYIPEFKSPRVLDRLNWSDTTYTTQPSKSEITIRQLLRLLLLRRAFRHTFINGPIILSCFGAD